MPINLSIKNVPDELAERLRQRAKRAHRSLQGELRSILEQAVVPRRRLTAARILQRVKAAGVQTADEAAGLLRADRDAR